MRCLRRPKEGDLFGRLPIYTRLAIVAAVLVTFAALYEVWPAAAFYAAFALTAAAIAKYINS